MADKKISQLQAATLPLAGTELLPIVQSGTTVNITVNNLAVGNIKSNATTGVLQVTGPAAASTRVMTTPDANFTAARTDAAQTFTGNQTVNTGNLVIGTSGTGIDFSATAGTGTSELLADYEEGAWTPAMSSISGTLTTVGACNGTYTKVGRNVTISFDCTITTNGTGETAITITGLPYSPTGVYIGGTGRELSTSKCLTFGISSGISNIAYMTFYDGTYPGADGARFSGSFTYQA